MIVFKFRHYSRLDGALDPWLSNFWQRIDQLMPLPPGLSAIPSNVLYPSSYNLVFLKYPNSLSRTSRTISPSVTSTSQKEAFVASPDPAADMAQSGNNIAYCSSSSNSSNDDGTETTRLVTLPFLNTACATVVSNERMTASDHFQDVRHIVLDIEATETASVMTTEANEATAAAIGANTRATEATAAEIGTAKPSSSAKSSFR
jgi:hypothetical protein